MAMRLAATVSGVFACAATNAVGAPVTSSTLPSYPIARTLASLTPPSYLIAF